ncbi:MAG: ABC transporter permease [Proteobacteria bacterium]|nr:ABC transporter permease [Pseudomonadota bacterium]
MFNAAIALISKDVRRALRQKMRLLSTLSRPLLWLFVIGTGLGSVIQPLNDYPYQTYLIPGLVGMVLLFGGILSALTTALEKDFGTLRFLLIAPFSRGWIIIFRALSAAIIAIIYTLLFVLIILPFYFYPKEVDYSLLVMTIITSALLWGAFGMLLVVFSKTSENFSVIMNFVVFPLYFLSGGLYPLHNLPPIMKQVVQLNPFTYCVDMLQHSMHLDGLAHYTVTMDIAVMLSAAFVFVFIAVILFLRKPYEELI